MEVILSAYEWAYAQWGSAELGDKRRTKRAVEIGAAMAAKPDASLPEQMLGNWYDLKACYLLLNNERITLADLAFPHWQNTRQAASRQNVVLFAQDTTELDYTHHPTKTNLGPIGNGKGRGLLLHSSLAIIPSKIPQILGMAYQEVVLRQPTPDPRPRDYTSPEGLLWTSTVTNIGRAPAGCLWVHMADRGSDDFRFRHEVKKLDCEYLIRTKHNRLLEWPEGVEITPSMRKLKDYVRTLPAQHSYFLEVPAQHDRPARIAKMQLSWTKITLPAPQNTHPDLREWPSIDEWVVRAWEIDAPSEVEQPIEWILETTVKTVSVLDALERVDWYTCRWLDEDYHKCLKTGCHIEKSQLNDGEDIKRLLGFLGLIALYLLQVRQFSRWRPNEPALKCISPLMLIILCQLVSRLVANTLTMGQFWGEVAKLGGHLGRQCDGPAGWQTIWRGWLYLSNLTMGAKLYRAFMAEQQFLALLRETNEILFDTT